MSSVEIPAPSVSSQEPEIVHPELERELTKMEMSDTSIPDKKSVCSFYLDGKCRFGDGCFNLHPKDVKVKLPDKKGNSSSAKRKESIEVKDKCKKKPPMKTAGDVRKRIQWDPDLNKDQFTVGYLDRFEGVLEKPFTAFTWEHLALLDMSQLGIPQHRIQYFTYKGTKVWDKNERLDNVFGSVGSNITIQQVIQEVDAENERKRQTYDSDESDSDDDEIVMTSNPLEVKELVENQKAEYDQLRASHFLCIRVYNDELKSACSEVQEAMIMEEPILRSCAMPLELFHVTLSMIRIDTPEALAEVISLLQELQPRLKAIMSDPQERKIISKGLSTFGARVLYTKLQVPESFAHIVEILQESLEKIEGLVITNHFDFVPHMTLMKVNRVIARERRSKYLNSSLYNDHIDRDYGIISIDNINLCIIDDRRGYDGFYLRCKTIEF